MENWGKVQIITKISGKIGGKIGEKIGGKIITKIGGKTCGKICGKIITNIGEKIITKIGGKSRWKISEKSVEKSVEKLVEKSVEKGKGAKEKSGISLVLNQTGGSPSVNKNPNLKFANVFFQWACRIILGPPKHVLHLVWSAYVLSTAIGTALKIARGSQIMGKRRPVL